MKKINIAIDGPSGAGKSTISDLLAKKLAYVHLDTGAMYRSVALLALRNNLKIDDEDKIVELIKDIDFEQKLDGTILLNGEDVTKAIRENDISMAASNVSKLNGVRKQLVALQKKTASKKGYIVDGRDICEVVLPDAEVKIYLTASPETRAQRRLLQNAQNGIESNYQEILDDIIARDYQDSHREFSPLRQAKDATLVDSSNITKEEVVDIIYKMALQKLK